MDTWRHKTQPRCVWMQRMGVNACFSSTNVICICWQVHTNYWCRTVVKANEVEQRICLFLITSVFLRLFERLFWAVSSIFIINNLFVNQGWTRRHMLTNFAEFILRNLSLTDRPFIRSHSRKNQVQIKLKKVFIMFRLNHPLVLLKTF